MKTLVIHELVFIQDFHTFTFILLIKIVLCSKFSWTNLISDQCFDVRSDAPHPFDGRSTAK